MKIKTIFLSTILSLTIGTFYNQQINKSIDAGLIEIYKKEKKVDCLIQFKQTADLKGAKLLKTKKEKGQFVYRQLSNVAKKSQVEVKNYLIANKIDYNSFILVNAISVKLNEKQANDISQLRNVKSIAHDPTIKLENYNEEINTKELEIPEPEWGIKKIQADSVWRLGYEGEGVVIGGQDTGFEWEHPVLIDKYLGSNGMVVDHNYNWHDAIKELARPGVNPCGLNSLFPCDDNDHGTHTMGTMVGSDSDNAIGVAPKSKWIACRNMERGIGKPSTYIECLEWFLAPTDLNNENPLPERAPDVVNNSWSCPDTEGCNETNWQLMEDAIIALKASGIFVSISAGNSGSNCGTINRAPAIFESSFSVGASRGDDLIADFSSRGPVTIDNSLRLKPEITAPGSGIRSSVRGFQFREFSGTSMASPHVVGTVALIINANPNLRGDVAAIENILKQSTVKAFDNENCENISGEESPNTTFGHGILNALKAVELATALTSIHENEIDNFNVNIYPNPSHGIINIDYQDFRNDSRLKDGQLMVYNTQGKFIQKKEKLSPSLNLTSQESGLYFIRIFIDAQIITKKVWITRP